MAKLELGCARDSTPFSLNRRLPRQPMIRGLPCPLQRGHWTSRNATRLAAPANNSERPTLKGTLQRTPAVTLRRGFYMEPTDAAISGPFTAGTGTDCCFARACA